MKTPRKSKSTGPTKGGFEKGSFGGRPSRSKPSAKQKAKDKAGAPASQRQLRAGELVRHALAEVLRGEELADPVMAGVSITVTEARMSPDLRHATVFIEPLGRTNAPEVAAAMNRASKFLRGRLGRHIELKFTPDLHFIADYSFDEAARMNALFAKAEVARDLGAEPPSSPLPLEGGEVGSGGESSPQVPTARPQATPPSSRGTPTPFPDPSPLKGEGRG